MNLCMLKKLLAIPPIALCLVGISLQASAAPYTTCGEPGRLDCVVPAIGPTDPTPAQVTGKEMSTHTPGTWGTGGDRDASGVLDPEQNIAWDGIGGTADTFDYSGSRTIGGRVDEDREVDALANSGDAFYHAVIDNLVTLVFSVDDDPNIYSETIFGVGSTWADQSRSQGDGAPGSQIDNMRPIRDTDGLELWGGDGPQQDDANNYSLESVTGPKTYTPVPSKPGDPAIYGGDPDPNGVAVWNYAGGVSTPNWLTSEIALIVALASGIDIGLLQNINLDAMMTTDPNDILFSIDPVIARDGSTLLDGGEIFVGVRGTSGKYLDHGLHLWNTAFDVRGTFGLDNENINALEAISMLETVPEPSILALVSLAGVILLFRRRRVA